MSFLKDSMGEGDFNKVQEQMPGVEGAVEKYSSGDSGGGAAGLFGSAMSSFGGGSGSSGGGSVAGGWRLASVVGCAHFQGHQPQRDATVFAFGCTLDQEQVWY